MRRSILLATSAIAFAGAMAIGPFGAAAAAPYVYGCTPATLLSGTSYGEYLFIYNGSASTAHLTTKVLAGTGDVLNGTLSPNPVPVLQTLLATHTLTTMWDSRINSIPEDYNPLAAASVRIVSNVPVSATLSHDISFTGAMPIVCTSQQP